MRPAVIRVACQRIMTTSSNRATWRPRAHADFDALLNQRAPPDHFGMNRKSQATQHRAEA
jgi:hypothetical protein